MRKNPAAPGDVASFHTRLAELSPAMPKRLRQCADFVARNPDRIAVSTVADLARAAGVQPSAFVRFCQIMGFSGFSDLQTLFRGELAERWPDYATRLENLRADGEARPAALLAEFVEAGRASLEMLAHQVDAGALERAVGLLSEAGIIHILGLSRAYPVAAYLSYAFEKMDIPTMLHDKTGNLDHRHSIRRGDVLLAISFSPYTPETVALAGFAHGLGVELVAITDALNSPFHKLGAEALIVSEVDVGAFRALSATLSLAISLAVAVGARREIGPGSAESGRK